MKIRWWHHHDCLSISIVITCEYARMEKRANLLDFNGVMVMIRISISFLLGSDEFLGH